MNASGLRARAAVLVERDGDASRFTELRSEPPLTLRPTPGALYLVGTSAGPLGGDDLALDVGVGPDAELEMRSVAASLVQPGAHPRPVASRLVVNATVAGGGELRWLPEATVLVRGCDHRATATVDLEVGSSLVWREELVLGRHDEDPGSVLQRLRVERGGAPLLANDLAVGPLWPGSAGPGVMDGRRVVGTLVVVGWPAPEPVVRRGDDLSVAVMPIADDAVLVTATADRSEPLRRALDQWLPDGGGWR